MHPGAASFRGSVEILSEDGETIARCSDARNLNGIVYANYPQDFGDVPQRLGAGNYKVRWTNIALSKVVGEKDFEIDQFLRVMQSKELRKAVKKLDRRARLRKLTERDT